MPWEKNANNIERINGGQQLTASSNATPELMNALVQFLMYAKEV